MNKMHLTFAATETSTADFYRDAEGETPLALVEEQDLGWSVINDGCAESFERLVRANRKLVLECARRFRDRGLSWEELLEHGREGLRVAVEQFDPGQGMRFSTHANWWIKFSIKRALQAALPGAGGLRLAFAKSSPRKSG